MGRQVLGRDGRRWHVRRHWAPRLGNETVWGRLTRRIRAMTRRAQPDVDPGCLSVFEEGLAIGLVVIAAGLFLIFIGLPLLMAIVDVVIVLLLTIAGVLSRMLFRRPWTIEASSADSTTREYRVVGWRDSNDLVRELARRIEHGEQLPPTIAI